MDDLNINELPPEILAMIFGFLTVREKFNCIRVCKRFYWIISNSKLRSLVIAQDSLPVNERWAFTFEPVSLCSSIISLDLDLIETQMKRELFSSLRSLFISLCNLSYLSSSFVDSLNRLQLLERLELPLILLNGRRTLALANLRILSLKQVHGNRLSLRTPKLGKLRLQSACFDSLEIVFPDELKQLDCAEFELCINRFVHLECLFCLSISDLNEHFLLNLPELKELHFERDHFAFYSLANQQRLLHRPGLAVYYQGLRSRGYLEANLNFGSDSLNEENVGIYLSNYDELPNRLVFIKYINYNCLESKQVPEEFIKKFPHLNGVWIERKIEDELKFANFLIGCPNFSLLKLNFSGLSPEFYSVLLPTLCATIKNLEIKDEPNLIEELSFEFIRNFHYLTTLVTNKRIGVEFVYEAFKELKYLCSFTFRGCFASSAHNLEGDSSSANHDNENNADQETVKVQCFKQNFEVSMNNEILFYNTLDELYHSLKGFGL